MNDFTVGLAAPAWIVVLVVLAAFAFAVFTYSRTLPPVPPLRRWSLILLRTIGIGLLLLAIFEPVMSFLRINAEDPQVVVAIDNSESMTLGGQDSARFHEARGIGRNLQESDLANQSRFVLFSDSTTPLDAPLPVERIDATGGETRLDAPFRLTADSLRRNNIRAIVLLSDGRYNAGSNPLFEAEKLGVPVFAVGLGDSVEPKDLSVQQLFTNEIAYLGTELPVEVRVKSAGYDGGMATVTLRDDAGVVASQQLAMAPGTNEYTTTFIYRPKSEGIAKLRADIAPGANELTTKNNSRSTFVRVKSNKRRYVLIGGGPNPDVAFLRRLLARDPNIEVKSYIQKSGTEFIEGKLDATSFRDAEAVVLVGYPTAVTSETTLRTLRAAVENGNLPLFVVMGATVDVNKLKTLESLLPVTFGTPRASEMQVFAELTEAGLSNPIIRTTQPEAWSQLPPIYRTETPARARAESEVLARARLSNVSLDEPLIVSRRLGRSRSLIVLGYGIYRWELLGEGPRQARGETPPTVLEDFVTNALRWIAVRDEQKQVRITSSKQNYNLGEPVRLLAQVYDESYQPLSDAEVVVTVQGTGRSYNLALASIGNGRYEATLSNLPPGDYGFAGRATFNGRDLGRDAGRFSVGEIGLEFLQPSMNAELLRALAARTGGKFYTARETGSLVEDIREHSGFAPRTIQTNDDVPLWSNPWALAAALLAFATEWIIRKRSGML